MILPGSINIIAYQHILNEPKKEPKMTRTTAFSLSKLSLFIFIAPFLSPSKGLSEPNDAFSSIQQIDSRFPYFLGMQEKEAIDPMNNPINLAGSGTLTYALERIPESGKSRPVWTGSWWPLSEGGTAKIVSGSKSPLQKYGLATETGDRAHQWEVRSAARFGHVSWAGHCNGLAAAGIMTKEPRKSVEYNGVIFSTKDIKALLVEAYQGAGRIVGGRCNDRIVRTDQAGRALKPECRDLNPGTFVLALGNFIGLKGLPVILDKANGVEVWNFPVDAYKLYKREIDRATAGRLVYNNTGYPFNPRSERYYKVQIQTTYVPNKIQIYNAVIETDKQGNILGGEWIGESKQVHPDFVWTVSGPTAENPHLDVGLIKAIYALSI